MTHTISLNSTESLPIPPRTSSRLQDHSSVDMPHNQPVKPSPLRNGGRESSPNPNDGDSDGSKTPPSPASSYQARLKRKPIPPYLVSPNPASDLPADHPGYASRSANGLTGRNGETSSIRSAKSGSDAGTPGWREDKDLFFGGKEQVEDNQPTSLPPPPRRSNARRSPAPPQASQVPSPVVPTADTADVPISLGKPIAVPSESEVPDTTSRRGTFAGGLNIDVPGLNPQAMESQISTVTAISAGYETARTGPPSIASVESTPTPTVQNAKISPAMSEYYERPLPPLPQAQSTVSLGMSSILAAGPSENGHARSDSMSSRPSPVTPRLSQTMPNSPIIRGAENDAASTGKVYSALGGKKFPWKKKSSKHTHDEDDESEFSVSRVPSKRALWEAGTHFVRDENGGLVYFADLFPKWDQDSSKPPPSHTKAEFAKLSQTSLPYDTAASEHGSSSDPTRPPPRTVMFFIRFFWCGQCQDFLYASVNQLDPEALAKANIRVVIISNGSWKYIKSFRKLTKCPFPVYVDGPRKLYRLMGMTKTTMDMGFLPSQRGQYNQHSVPVQVLRSGVRIPSMPMTSSPGSITQLGGEFILEPGFECSFAHRMTNYSNHMEAPDVVRLAGCSAPTKEETKEIKLAAEEQAELERLTKQMNDWRTDRESELDRIRRKKAERRGVEYKPISPESRIELGLDGTPAFGPTNGDRRESAVSAMSFETARPGQDAPLDVTLDEAASSHTDEMEVLEGEMEDVNGMSENELDERFQQALKIEEEAKGRFESRRRSSATTAPVAA